jgi:hypothetical protein
VDHSQSQMLFISIKVAVIMQQIVVVFNAIRGNKTIYGLADNDSVASQHAIITRALQRQFGGNHLYLNIFPECAAGFFKISVVSKSLQDFRQNQVANQNRRFFRDLMKIIRLQIIDTVEVVNPNCGINNKQG